MELDFAQLFAALPAPHLVLTPDLVIRYANPAYLRTLRVTPEQIVGRELFAAFPPGPAALDPDGVPYIARSFARARATGRPDALPIERYPLVVPDTGLVEDRWWAVTAVPVLDEDGEVSVFVQRVDDLTEFVRDRGLPRTDGGDDHLESQVQQLQAELTTRTREVEAARETERRTSRTVEAMPSGFFSVDAGWRFTLLNAAAERLLGHDRGELLGRTIWEVFPEAVGNEFESAYRAAVETGEPQTLTAYYPAPLDTWYDVLAWPTGDGLSLYFSDVTDRQRTADEAGQLAARLALLALVNAELVEADDVPTAVAGLPGALTPALADACVLTVADGNGRLRDVGWAHTDPALRPVLDRYVQARSDAMHVHTTLNRVLESGRPVSVPGAELAAALPTGEARRQLELLGETRTVKLPVRGRGTVFGALTLLSAASRPMDPAWESTAQEIADRIGLALDNARLTRAQATIAESLQRSLLTDPPQPAHEEIAVRYLPAAAAAQVGGDWYDAFVQRGAGTMLVIGDVVGHDTAAAAAMGQLRGLLRGIATYSGGGPAEVLRGLDESMETLVVGTLATAAVARFEQTTDELARGVTRLVWASAGHPPPLVIAPDGVVTVLDDGRADLLLGVDPAVRRRDRVHLLERGDTVVLYTDGLVERRDASLDDGLARLVDAAADLAGASLDELCDGVLDRMVHGRPDDDVALVAVRLHPQRDRQLAGATPAAALAPAGGPA
ncbi:SpoIIE family protein phosphatase [Modestobacter roseus]|uniref:SpoIIE family protein phosphatase n=1 Tax=Modestobacter roseus TaxID=1181884 RepID=UPI0034DE5ACE